MNRKNRILVITTELNRNGDYLGFFYDWVRHLSYHCKKLNVIAIRGDPETRFDEKNISYKIISKNNKLFRMIYLSKLILQEMRSNDIIFVHMYYPGAIIAGIFSKIMKKPCIYWNCIGNFKKIPLIIAFSLVNKVVTCSYFVKNNFVKSLPIKPKKIEVIGHGINDKKFSEEKLKISFRKFPIILSVNRISPSKDIITTLKAIDLLYKDYPNLLFVNIGKIEYYEGENSKYFRDILKFIKHKKLENNIKLINSVSYNEIAKYYNGCDLFVSSSITGSIDKNLIEAVFSNKPIIGTELNYKELLYSHPEFLFPKRNSLELYKRMKYILENKSLIEEKILEIKEEFLRNYSLDIFIKKLVNSF
ncbi:MAG: glycosyltransferase family 4 protein [Candidatus Helarchaeota archaeon]